MYLHPEKSGDVTLLVSAVPETERSGMNRIGSDECACFYGGRWNVLQDPSGITVQWTRRAGCLWGADWAGSWSINYDEKASARLTPLHLCLICSQGEILFSLQDQGGKWPGNRSAKPSVGRLCLGVVQHLLVYFPMELSALFFFLPKWFLAPCEIDQYFIMAGQALILKMSHILSPVYKLWQQWTNPPEVVSVW